MAERTYKSVTLHQPWATLIAAGLKQYETRSSKISWRNYSGDLLIHVGVQKMTESGWELLEDLEGLGYDVPLDYPLGAFVAVARMSGSLTMCDRPTMGREIDMSCVSPLEKMVGYWLLARLAIPLLDVQVINPILAKGKQGLWTPKAEHVEMIGLQ
jgi:hypothetical protein